MVKRSAYKTLVFQNLSNCLIDVTFHNYVNSVYIFQSEIDFQIKPGDSLCYRLFLHGQRVKIICNLPRGTSKNGTPRFKRKVLIKQAFFKDTKFVVQQDETLSMEDVSGKEFSEGCFYELEELKIVQFTNEHEEPYHVTFHRSAFGKALPYTRTKTLFKIKKGDAFQKIFYNDLYIKVFLGEEQKLAKCLKDNSVVIMDVNKAVTVEKGNDIESVQALKEQLLLKCTDYEKFSNMNNFYDILNIREKVLASEVVEAKYESKLQKKKTRYTPEEIRIAYETLKDDQRRRQYDNYLDYQNEEKFMSEGYFKKKFLNWIWKARRWFSFCRSEPPAFNWKETCWRYFCLMVTLLCMIAYFIIGRFKQEDGFKSKGQVLAMYATSFASYFGLKRIFNDKFKWVIWFWMSVFGAISGVLVGLAYYYTLTSVRLVTSESWVHQAAVSAVTAASISFLLSAVSDLSEMFLDGTKDDYWSVAKRGFYCTVVGAIAGAVLGIVADKVLQIKADVIHDDIVMEGALDGVRASLKACFNKQTGWMCLECLTKQGMTRGCPYLCVTTEHLVRYGKDEMIINEVQQEADVVVEVVKEAANEK